MIKSDVFDNFVKIAQEKGMISKKSSDSEDSKKKLEKNPRADSLDISAIEALYGVKPNVSKDMDYEHNIMEVAHPNYAVVSNSYDKLNGLVENDIQRQNININIINKVPNGNLTQHKYAEKDLFLYLVKLANDLDNNNQDNLVTLADTCLIQLKETSFKKEALPVIPIAIAVAVAAVLGGIYFKNHMQFISDGFEQDHQKLIKEIDDLISANSSTQTQLGAGYTYKPDFIQLMQSFRNKLNNYFNLYKKIEPYIDGLEKPKTASELEELAKKPETDEIMRAYNLFKAATDELLPFLLKIEADFDNEGYKQRQIAEKGTFMTLLDAPQIFHGGKGFIADDFDDVYHALKTYVGDIQSIMKALTDAESITKSALRDIQQATSENSHLFGNKKDEPLPPASQNDKSVKDIDQEADELSSLLEESGLK